MSPTPDHRHPVSDAATLQAFNIWQGQLVRLRAIEPNDWEVFHSNDLDSESARLSFMVPLPRSAAAAREWAENESKPPQDDNARFAIENTHGQLVGTINTWGCNPRAGTFGYGIGIFRQHRRKGYAREAIWLVLRYYFNELRYQKVTTNIDPINTPSLQLHLGLGFMVEGCTRRTAFTDGDFRDELVVGLTREEFLAQLHQTYPPPPPHAQKRNWLDWAREMQAIAQIGLTYAENAYDRERYTQLHALAVEVFSTYTGEEAVAVQKAITTQPGYVTPKVDVRGACFRDGKILLVRERADGKWCLPGGWADVGDLPSESAAREVHEEAGIACVVQKLVGVFDANRSGEPLSAYHAYKLVFLCQIIRSADDDAGDGKPNHETQAVAFFGRDEIPPLSEARTNSRVLAECFAHHDDVMRPCFFD